jgi:hypothetical protein
MPEEDDTKDWSRLRVGYTQAWRDAARAARELMLQDPAIRESVAKTRAYLGLPSITDPEKPVDSVEPEVTRTRFDLIEDD